MEYGYARCECGWYCPVEDMHAAQAAAKHVEECGHPMRELLVPMWSVEHPWYHSPTRDSDRYGIGIYWRPVGSHSIGSPFGHGGTAKTYHLFPTPKREAVVNPVEVPTELRLARIEYALIRLAADLVHAHDPPAWSLNKEISDILYGFKDKNLLALREGREPDEGAVT